MNDQDYIRKAVELAGRWFITKELRNSVDSGIRCMDVDYPWFISADDLRGRPSGPGVDALAAQLVRQVDERPNAPGGGAWADCFCFFPPDRTMNTIKAIVDSKVLEKNNE